MFFTQVGMSAETPNMISVVSKDVNLNFPGVIYDVDYSLKVFSGSPGVRITIATTIETHKKLHRTVENDMNDCFNDLD